VPVYLVTSISVHDEDAYRDYTRAGRSIVARFGGKLVAAGVTPEIVEGDWNPSRMAIVEFQSREVAWAFYNSSDYQAARELRRGVAEFNMVLVPGSISPISGNGN
jgi:uncharacterized protein (DUF1330 family)